MLWWVGPAGMAQDSPTSDLNARSLPLRTALHHDPTLVSPLERLLSMYRSAGRTDELIGMYRAHVTQYPNDAPARTVLVRLLASTGDPETVRAARGAVAQLPENAYLRYVLYEILRAKQDFHQEALDELDRAIELETRWARKIAWIDLLLPAAVVEDRRDLAEKHLRAMARLIDAPEQRLEVARRMIKYKFFEPALELLKKKSPTPPAPETMVSIELEAATAEVGLQKAEAAGARLDRLLSKLTADYWRREEIVRRRLALVKSQAEREAMIGAARKRVEENPRDEAAVLDLAQVLAGLQFRRDALDVLLEAGRRLPNSAGIEKRTLEVLDRLRDAHGREKYLAERINQTKQRQRADLVLLHVKTLYLLGRPGDALAELTELAETMEAAEKGNCLLEMARFLRRSTFPKDAAELFRRVVELAPQRLDVRRELAEVYLATGQRQRARELLSAVVSKEASPLDENLLDLVQFMIQQELFREARAALVERLEQEKENLDLRLLLLDVHRRLGNFAAGEKLIPQTRGLADTAARYRLWLEAAVAFHEDFDSVRAFLEAEQARLAEDPGEWTDRRLERRMAFAEIAGRSGRKKEVTAMLESDLADHPWPQGRVKLRRLLIEILDSVPGTPKEMTQDAEIQRELEELAKDDPQHADQYRARLALLHVKSKRQDLALALLEKIDVTRIRDTAVLSSLRPLLAQHPEGRKRMLTILERLTVLNPTERSYWQDWLTMLAISGDETRLRSVLRRLLAGVEKMPLAEETRTLLESHVADSYWRSIAACLAGDEDVLLPHALALLDSVERMAQDDQQWLWITWIRAYVLGRLGREQARDEAIEELQRVAGDIVASGDPSNASVLRIAFPDGFSIAFDHARQLLSAPPAPRAAPGVEPPQGPSPEFEVKWTYQTGAQSPVTAVVPLGAERILICDRQGGAHCLRAAGGKLLWKLEGLLPTALLLSPDSPYSGSRNARQALPPVPLADGRGRFFVPAISQVSCHAVDDGRLLWQADVGASPTLPAVAPGLAGRPFVSLFLYDGNLLSYEPVSAAVTRIDPATGKIAWDRTFAARPLGSGLFQTTTHGRPGMVTWHNSGASLCGNRLLIYGARTAVVDLRSGELEWSFEPWRVRKFPIKLRDPSIKESTLLAGGPTVYSPYTAMAQPAAYQFAVPPYGMGFGMGPYPAGYYPGAGSPYHPSRPTQYLSYLRASPFGGLPSGGVSLTSAAVVWASMVQRGAPRRAWLMGRRLLLFDQSGLQIVPTDLPLAGTRVEAAGQLVGMAGRVVCLLSGSQLQFVDVSSGNVKRYNLQEVIAQGATPIQAAMDGPLVYVSGPAGILCVNALTARRAFLTPWPAEIAPQTPAPTPTSTAAGRARAMAMRGISRPVPYPPGSYGGYSGPFPIGGAEGAQVPTINRIDRGVLYAMVTPNRVVALKERSANGQ